MSTFTIDDAVAQVVRVMRDYGTTAGTQELVDGEIVPFLRQAATIYSKHRPREVVEDVAADGTIFTQLPTAFVDDYSSLIRVERDANDWGESDPRFFSIYRTPTGLSLRWVSGIMPSNGELVRITYTSDRTWGDTAPATTILDRDFYAVCDLGVSIACAALAQKYARTSEPIVNAAVAGYRTKAQEWAGRATAYRKAYDDHMGIREGVAPASDSVNWDSRDSWGLDWLTHRRATR